MKIHEASVADVLRCHQRDQAFLSDLESKLHSLFNFFGGRVYHRISKLIPGIASVWYYYMTSFGNLQTLGEEYTGTVRFTNSKQSPTKLKQLTWLILYIGGEPLLNRALAYAETQISQSPTLTQQAKDVFLKLIRTFKSQKLVLQRIHHSLFYINGKYYNVANRLTGIKYVLLREWFQNDSFSGSFKLLGELTLFYIILDWVQKGLSVDNFSGTNIQTSNSTVESSKYCILCTDKLRSPTATPCGHIFCWDCLCDSLSYQKACPVCRVDVQLNRIIFLQNYL